MKTAIETYAPHHMLDGMSCSLLVFRLTEAGTMFSCPVTSLQIEGSGLRVLA